MKSFLSDNFLLQSHTAGDLYHGFAKTLPIIDYHTHLPPDEIAFNKNFKTLTQIWLAGDHYKWRAMRTLGINEKYITGDAPDKQKFIKWAGTVPYTVRNPLYHWTHMELKIYFGIDKLPSEENAEKIYEQCSGKLQEPSFSTQSLLKKMNVESLCTTDDPADSLEHHKSIRENPFGVDVLPSFRPDKVYSFEDVEKFNAYLNRLEKASGSTIRTLNDLLLVLEERIDYFHNQGGRLADHGLEKIYYADCSASEAGDAFVQIRGGKALHNAKKHGLIYRILLELGRMYHGKGWVQQYHLGPLRNNNERMLKKLGPDTGFDSIGDFSQAQPLARFLNDLDKTNQLAKTILYNNNPSDNAVIASMIGNFNDGSIKGKIQHGAAWWHMDQKDGIERHLNTLSNLSLLSCFIGMITDSRSFLSYSRHDYFRRILCNLIGQDVEKGLLPNDIDWLGKIISDICYNNASEYFDF